VWQSAGLALASASAPRKAINASQIKSASDLPSSQDCFEVDPFDELSQRQRLERR
jgi:hypothetical protein